MTANQGRELTIKNQELIQYEGLWKEYTFMFGAKVFWRFVCWFLFECWMAVSSVSFWCEEDGQEGRTDGRFYHRGHF